MANDNIFSGLKVVDFASFIAGPGAAVILSDFGADVIKVEPPAGDLWRIGHKIPPQPQAKDAYPWHLANRNKRGMTLDLKSPSAKQVLERLVKWADVLIVNTPHPARKKLRLEYDDVAQWNPRLIYADVTGFGEKGPDANLPGFDITSYWARSGLLSMTRDAGAPPTWPVAGSGDNATAVGLYSAIVTALYRRERTGKGSYVTTSLLAEGIWSASVSIQAALCEAKFFAPHDRKNPANAALNVYRASDGTWFVLLVTPDKLAVRRESDRPPGSPDRPAVFRSGEACRAHVRADGRFLTMSSAQSRWRIGARSSMAFMSRSAPCADRKRLSTTPNCARTTSSFRSKARAASSPRRSAVRFRYMASLK